MIFNLFFFCLHYNMIAKVSLSDSKLRALVYYTFISILLSACCVHVFPSLAGPSTGEEQGIMTLLLIVTIEVIAKQCMNILVFLIEFLYFFTPCYTSLCFPTPPISRSVGNFMQEFGIFVVVHLVLNIVMVTVFFAMVS